MDIFGGIAALGHGSHRQILAPGGAIAAGPDSGNRTAPRRVHGDLAIRQREGLWCAASVCPMALNT